MTPTWIAITAADLFAFGSSIRDFAARDDFNVLRRTLFANGQFHDAPDANRGFLRNHLANLHATHVRLYNVGQVTAAPRIGTRTVENWTDRLLPEPCPPKIRAVIERYLQLRLDAKLDRPQTVHNARQALRRFVNWLGENHRQVSSFAQVDRAIIEEYMRWLPTCPSQHTGLPLATTTVKHELNAIAGFCRDTAVWGWAEVPGRPLLTSRDTPRRPESIPRYLPQHELDAIMTAVDDLADPLQRAALLLLRWSGARRDEIHRLTWDCLDTYPGGHPRLRIPVGKGRTERIVPLHPDAAAALEHAIGLARVQRSIARIDEVTGRRVDYVFIRRGKLLSSKTLFDEAFRTVCGAMGLVDDRGSPAVSAHRFRHTLGTQLAEGGARIQTIMYSDIAVPRCR
ncbi:tyrosine-type recombinase/integrase [Rhodococcus opacus]|uniref:tyrosine-type recombinase/integrase n=1 Tax=Rhodococcus opacus TaxID=37919 RepID=UPI000B176E28|nr:tyrosine-type recombinase/integrase [Rhodococcus opacus]